MTVSILHIDTIFVKTACPIPEYKINPRIMHILKLTKYNWVGWEEMKGGGGNWD